YPGPECRYEASMEDGASLLLGPCCDTATLYQAIADQIGCDVSQLCFQQDPHGLAQGNFTFAGKKVQGIVAVATRGTGPVEASFTFVDARRVGRGIRAFLRNVWVEASSILRCVDPKVPPGYSVSLYTQACSANETTVPPWDWQEVCFRADNDNQLEDASPQPATVSAEATTQVVAPTAASGAAASDASPIGIYAAIANGPLDPAHLPVERATDAAPAEGIWFLLFAPDRRPETIWIAAQPPYTWDEASAAISDARDPLCKTLYEYVCQVHPQPSAEFASLICLPKWAQHRTAVLLDSRSFDGRLYCLIIDPWIQWMSFLLYTGLPDVDTLVVVVNGVVRTRGRPLVLKQGDLIQALEYGASIPPLLDLGDLMFVGDRWEADPPLAFSSSFSHFWVLHEGGARGIDVDYHAIDNAYGFQEFAADALQFAQHRTSLKTASPRIGDAMYKGILCRAVVLVTECLPTLPVPPARVTVPLTVVFLDMRPVLRGFEWRILARGETALDVFTQGLHLEPPTGHHILVQGGSRAVRKGVTFLQAEDRTVLTISYVEQNEVRPVEESGADDDSSGPSTDSGSDNDGGDPDRTARSIHDAPRSRSPRTSRTKHRNRGNRTGTDSAAAPSVAAVAKLEAVMQLPITVYAENHETLCSGPSGVGLRCSHTPPGDTHKIGQVCELQGVACKILTEPSHNSLHSERTIAYLRYVAPRLGFPWRYMTPANAMFIEDGSESDSDIDTIPSPPLRVGFRILVPGYVAEKVEVSLVFPTTLPEVVSIVQAARCRSRAQNFPRLVPASPQPLVGDGVFLACPSWSIEIATSRTQVCIDCSELDGRVYSALLPQYVCGANIPELVNLPSNLEYSVFAGPYGDLLQWDSQCHLAVGDTIFIRPEDSPPPTVVPLQVALLGRQHWGRNPSMPEPKSHGICCTVFGADNILHMNVREQRVNFRTQLANALGVSQCSMRIISSCPRVLDAAIDGFPCRSVILVQEGTPLGSPNLHWVLLDARALFLGWRSLPAPRGQLSCRNTVDDLLREVGSGWRLWLKDVPFSADILDTREGQVFAVEVIHERILPPQDGSGAANDVMAAPVTAASNRPAEDSHTGSDVAPSRGASSGQHPADNNGSANSVRSTDQRTTRPDSRDAEVPSSDDSPAYAEVPFLLLKQNYDHEWVTVRLYPGAIIAIDSRASNGRLFAIQVIGNGDLILIQSRQAPHHAVSSLADMLQCRDTDNIKPGMSLLIMSEYVIDSVASHGSQAFFLAATLLETIFEHFAAGIFSPPLADQTKQLRLQEHVPPPSFNLDVDRVLLPHSKSLLSRLVQPWPSNWLLPSDWAREDLPSTTQDQLKDTVPWKHFLSTAPSAELTFTLFTDGSDISWLAVEQDARMHHAIPIYDGALYVEPPYASAEPLRPENLVPVIGGECEQAVAPGQCCWTQLATINVQSLRGKCKYIEEQLHYRAVNVACLQETKLDGGTITSQHYLRLHSCADSHWGVAVWVHKQLGVLCIDDGPLHVDEHDVAVLHESPRLLVLLITKGQLKIGILSGHCPHSHRPEERDAFLTSIALPLRRLKHAHLILGGIDLNGRIPPNFQGVSGSLEFGEADATGWKFASLLADNGIWVPSLYTQLHCGESATYTHPSGKQHRIDYTLVGHLDANGHTRKLRRVRYDRDRIMTDEGKATRKRASYIPERVWSLRTQKLGFKRRVRHRSQLWRDLTCRAFLQWKEQQDYGVLALLGKQCRLYELAAAAVKFATRVIKKEILVAKSAFLHQIAGEGHQGAAKILQRVKQAGVGGSKSRPVSRPLPLLMHPSDGSTVTTRKQRDEVWMLHFGKQEQGQAIAIHTFLKEAEYSCYQPDLEWTADMLPTYADVEKVLRLIPRNKAAGLDNIPGEVLKAVPAEAAIVRELAVGDIRADCTVVRLFERFGLTGEDLHDLLTTVESGGMLAQAGAPDALRQVVKDIHLHTWFVSRFSDGTQVCSSLAGSRPGESWADPIYAYIYGRVLSKIHEYAVAEDLTFQVSYDPTSGVFPTGDGVDSVPATDATWADDSAFPLIADNPEGLMRKTQRLCTLVISFCEGHGMAPNLKPGKTSVMISLRGKGHKKVRQAFFPQGTQQLLLPDLGVSIVVTDHYKHLGGFVDCKLAMRHEVRHRLAQASSSYDSAKTLLLGSSKLALATRAALFESAVTPTFFNIGLWVPKGQAWDSLCNGYSKLVRRLLVPNVGAHRAFHAGPPLLWAMLQEETTWLEAIREDLRPSADE
ncbi:rbcL, partial [Symbiodinium necroappetens]